MLILILFFLLVILCILAAIFDDSERRCILIFTLLIPFSVSAQTRTFVKDVGTLSELLALNPGDINKTVLLKGYATTTDGLGGIFTYDATSSAATNTTSVFKPLGFNGRWLRVTLPAVGVTIPTSFTNLTLIGATNINGIYTGGVFDGLELTKQVDTIAALQSASVSNKSVLVKGYYTPGDGGGGLFFLTNTVSLTNTGTRFVSSSTNYSWERIREPRVFNVKWFGVKGDGKIIPEARIATGSSTLISTNSIFVSSDVGKKVVIYGVGPLTSGYRQPLNTTILSILNTTNATLSTTAVIGVTNAARCLIGSDDTDLIQATVDALANESGGVLEIPPGIYLTHGINMQDAVIGTFANGTGVRTYHNIWIKGSGREITTLENWDVSLTPIVGGANNGNYNGIITVGYHGNVPTDVPGNDRVKNIIVSDLTLRQVTNSTSVLHCMDTFATDGVQIYNTRMEGSSYECLIMGGDAYGKNWYVHHNIIKDCGHGGPGYGLPTSGLNLNGMDWLAEFNEVINCAQGAEIGAARAVFRSNRITGSTYGVNVGSTGCGIWDLTIANNTFASDNIGIYAINVIGSLCNVKMHDNTFYDCAIPIQFTGGIEVNSVNQVGRIAPYIHGTSIISGNSATWSTNAQISGFIVIGDSNDPQYNLENVQVNNNSAFFKTNAVSTSVNLIAVNKNYGGGPKWLRSTSYALGVFGVPVLDNGFYYKVTTAGTSGTSEPSWPTSGTVTDGSVVWTFQGIRPKISIAGFYAHCDYDPVSIVGVGQMVSLRNTSRRVVGMQNISANFPWRIEPNGSQRDIEAFDESDIPFNAFYSDRERFSDVIPDHGFFALGTKINKKTVTGTNYIVSRAGEAAPTWIASISYLQNDFVQPVTNNGHFYYATIGGTSGSSQPTFPTSPGGTVVDGGVTWKEGGVSAGFTDTSASVGNYVLSANGYATNLTVYSPFGFGTNVFFETFSNDALTLRHGSDNAVYLFLEANRTDASNLDRLYISNEANDVFIAHTVSGSGVSKNFTIGTGTGSGNVYVKSAGLLNFQTGGTSPRWTISSTGHFISESDGSYDIGALGTSRPRHIYVSGNNTVSGNTIFPPSTLQTLAAANTISPNATKLRVVGSGGAVTITATPSVTTSSVADGTIIYILGTSDTNTITVSDKDSVANTALQLGAASRTLGKGDILVLMYDATDSFWYEVSFANN